MLRQRAYVRALATNPKTITHFGRFERDRRCTINGLNGRRKFHFREEIRDVDVKLTTALMADAFTGACDVAVVVTSNSELRVPIAAVRKHGVRVGIVNPREGHEGNALREHADFFIRPLPQSYVAAQFPRRIRDEHGAITAPPRVGAALKSFRQLSTGEREGPPRGAGLPPSRLSGPGCVQQTLGSADHARQ